jgi:ribonuclease BN (tRNA processing enzyme)
MRLTIIGCGDAFGAGGRLQTSFHVRSRASTFLIDCGVTSLIGMRRLGFQPNEIDTVFVSHLHGDHFGGLPWLLVDALYVSNRNRPLIVTGPSIPTLPPPSEASSLASSNMKSGRRSQSAA